LDQKSGECSRPVCAVQCTASRSLLLLLRDGSCAWKSRRRATGSMDPSASASHVLGHRRRKTGPRLSRTSGLRSEAVRTASSSSNKLSCRWPRPAYTSWRKAASTATASGCRHILRAWHSSAHTGSPLLFLGLLVVQTPVIKVRPKKAHRRKRLAASIKLHSTDDLEARLNTDSPASRPSF
jgi:hypothetical protein